MSDILKTALQRFIQIAVSGLAGWLVAQGTLPQGQEQAFIGAAFFLAAWLVDTFIIHKQKSNAAISGGMAVGDASSDSFTAAEVKSIVKDVPK